MTSNEVLSLTRVLIQGAIEGDLTVTGQKNLKSYWGQLEEIMKDPYAIKPIDWDPEVENK